MESICPNRSIDFAACLCCKIRISRRFEIELPVAKFNYMRSFAPVPPLFTCPQSFSSSLIEIYLPILFPIFVAFLAPFISSLRLPILLFLRREFSKPKTLASALLFALLHFCYISNMLSSYAIYNIWNTNGEESHVL